MLHINENDKGKLISINDLIASVPFTVKRFMEITSVPDGETRGNHAHRENKQLLLCFQGRVIVETECKNNEGSFEEETHELDAGDFLYMPPLTWANQTYYDNAVLHVLCSKSYDEEDYVRDYEEFKQL